MQHGRWLDYWRLGMKTSAPFSVTSARWANSFYSYSPGFERCFADADEHWTLFRCLYLHRARGHWEKETR